VGQPIVGGELCYCSPPTKPKLSREVKNMGKLKLAGIIFVAFIIGVFVGISGNGRSSTTNSQEIKQSTSTNSPAPSEEAKDTGKVEVKSQSKKISSIGYMEIVGEVVNNTDRPVSSIKITATYYDEEGKVIGTSFSYAGDTSDTPLAVGATAPFEVSSYPDKIDTDNYKLDVNWN